MFTVALEDPIDKAIVQIVLEVLVLHVMIQVVVKMRVIDSVYVDVSVSSGKGFVEEGVMLLDICSMDRI